MKNFILALAIMVIAAPAWATDVVITCVDEGGGVVRIDYSVTGEPKLRALALDITVDSDATIDAISDFMIGESTADNKGFGIFPASFRNFVTVDEETGVPDWSDPNYSPLADPNDPGALNTGDLPQSAITIEMGALYYPADDSSPNAPPTSGTLCKVTVSGAPCTLSIAENSTRGGIVLTDPDVAANVTLGSCAVGGAVECFPSDYSTYNDWVAMGKPDCWCAPPDGSGYQCDGDADGVDSGFPFRYRVYNGDLALIVNNWRKKIDDATLNPCADIDHKDSGFPFRYRVYNADLSKIVDNWRKKDADLAGDCPRAE